MSNQERQLGALAHLCALVGFIIPFGNIIGPVIIAYLHKDKSEFVKYSALEALNFQITLTIAAFISAILCLLVIGYFLLVLVLIAGVVLPIIGAIKANQGEDYLYPGNIRLIKNI